VKHLKPFLSLLGACIAALLFAADCSAEQLPLNSLGGILHHVTESLKDPLQEVVEAPVKAIEPVTKALPEAAAPIQEVVDVVVKVVEPVTKTLPEAAAPIQEVVDVVVKVVEPVTKTLPDAAAPIQEVVDVVVKVVEPVTKTLADVAAPIQGVVETATVAVEPLTDTLSDTLAPLVNTVERTWSEVKPTADKLVDTIAPITGTVETLLQPQPGKAVNEVQQKQTEDKAVGDAAGKKREVETTPLSQTLTPSLVEEEEPSPTFEIEEPASGGAAAQSFAETRLKKPEIKQPEVKKPQSGNFATMNAPVMIPTDKTYIQTPAVVDEPGPFPADETQPIASKPDKPEKSSPAVMGPIEHHPDQPSRSVEVYEHPVEPDPMPLPHTDIPAAVLQGASSCPNVSKIAGGAAGLTVIGILNDDAHADVQSRLLLWVRSIELYKKWSNGPPGHPPKPSFSRVR
jgi:uncharacterized protein YoxC